jgi:hypothetical protein
MECVQQAGRVRGIAEFAVAGSSRAVDLVCFLCYMMSNFLRVHVVCSSLTQRLRDHVTLDLNKCTRLWKPLGFTSAIIDQRQ